MIYGNGVACNYKIFADKAKTTKFFIKFEYIFASTAYLYEGESLTNFYKKTKMEMSKIYELNSTMAGGK